MLARTLVLLSALIAGGFAVGLVLGQDGHKGDATAAADGSSPVRIRPLTIGIDEADVLTGAVPKLAPPRTVDRGTTQSAPPSPPPTVQPTQPPPSAPQSHQAPK